MTAISILALGAIALSATPAPERVWAVTNLRILTVSSPPIDRGTILVTGERITAVGASVRIPVGAQVVDGAGLTASPGFIDLGTGIGLTEIAQVPAANDADESSDPLTPHVRAADAYFLDSELIPVVRAAGTTIILSTPGPSNVIAGQSALMRTAGESLSDVAVVERAALHVNLGEGPKLVWGGRGRAPVTRQGIASLLRQTLQQARDYAARRAANPTSLSDPKLEAVAEAVAGGLPVVVRAQRRDDILLGLEIAREFGLKMILSGGADAPRVAAQLREQRVPVIVQIDQQPDGFENAAAAYGNAARLNAAGVIVAFQSNEVTLSRNLVPNVGLAVAYGLSPEDALRALTLNAARIFGVDDRLGSIEVGKEATFILTRGDPLQVRSHVNAIYIRGRRYPPRSYQTVLCETYIAPKGRGIPCLSQ